MDISNTIVEENAVKRTNYPGSVYSADADGEPDDGQGKADSDLLVSCPAVLDRIS